MTLPYQGPQEQWLLRAALWPELDGVAPQAGLFPVALGSFVGISDVCTAD